ncbi:glycosyltransferase family 4 protein [Glaciecola sp. SC05]|uniref:glycosyltransferase family 4 protein n=1 Tax=Glaciecola sp. SC05 TaxID=1987355 RepID=UPI003527CF03
MNQSPHILQFICSTGFYGAERWILALCKNTPKEQAKYSLAVTKEDASQDLELVKQFARDCGDTYEAPMSNRFDKSVIDKLADYIIRNKVDVIHTHGYKSDIIGILAAKKAKIPVVVTPHGFENADDFKLRLFIWLGCQSMRFADHVVPLSPQLMQDVQRYGVKPPQLQYIQNGVDLSEVEAVREAPAKLVKPKKRIGFIGQMISRKNIVDILDIFDEMAATRDDIELVLLGDGDERQHLEEHANTLASIKDIHFLGYRDDRLDYLRSFDLFVMTSTLEGIPRCLMEACAMATPVAAYDIAGIDQLVKHEQTGLLAKLGDKSSLKAHWQNLLDDENLAKQIGENALRYVNENYAAKRMADEYMTLFNQLLTDRK